jgi:hypothetical protein
VQAEPLGHEVEPAPHRAGGLAVLEREHDLPAEEQPPQEGAVGRGVAGGRRLGPVLRVG